MVYICSRAPNTETRVADRRRFDLIQIAEEIVRYVFPCAFVPLCHPSSLKPCSC